MLAILHACLSLSLINMVFPSWSFTQPVRVMDLPFSAALASFFSALATFLSPAAGLAAGSCAARLNEAVVRNANNNGSKRFIGFSSRRFLPSTVFEMLLLGQRRAGIVIKTNNLAQHRTGENVALK